MGPLYLSWSRVVPAPPAGDRSCPCSCCYRRSCLRSPEVLPWWAESGGGDDGGGGGRQEADRLVRVAGFGCEGGSRLPRAPRANCQVPCRYSCRWGMTPSLSDLWSDTCRIPNPELRECSREYHDLGKAGHLQPTGEPHDSYCLTEARTCVRACRKEW